jgi:hypothetical protein
LNRETIHDPAESEIWRELDKALDEANELDRREDEK